jgi:hypothetical protein
MQRETIAKSAPIYPGQHIDGLTPFRQVSPGNYSVDSGNPVIQQGYKSFNRWDGPGTTKIHLSVS